MISSYNDPLQRDRYLFWAVLAGAAPLLLGTVILTLFWFTHSLGLLRAGELLIPAGILLIPASLPVYFIGVWCLHRYRKLNHKNTYAAQDWLMKYRLCALLFILNFPIAVLYAYWGFEIETSIEITLVNHSGSTLDQAHLIGGRIDEELAPLAPNEIKSIWVWAGTDGELVLKISNPQSKNEAIIIGYTTHNSGDYVKVTIAEDLSMQVAH